MDPQETVAWSSGAFGMHRRRRAACTRLSRTVRKRAEAAASSSQAAERGKRLGVVERSSFRFGGCACPRSRPVRSTSRRPSSVRRRRVTWSRRLRSYSALRAGEGTAGGVFLIVTFLHKRQASFVFVLHPLFSALAATHGPHRQHNNIRDFPHPGSSHISASRLSNVSGPAICQCHHTLSRLGNSSSADARITTHTARTSRSLVRSHLHSHHSRKEGRCHPQKCSYADRLSSPPTFQPASTACPRSRRVSQPPSPCPVGPRLLANLPRCQLPL